MDKEKDLNFFILNLFSLFNKSYDNEGIQKYLNHPLLNTEPIKIIIVTPDAEPDYIPPPPPEQPVYSGGYSGTSGPGGGGGGGRFRDVVSYNNPWDSNYGDSVANQYVMDAQK
jgi:hypothetical protein